MNIEEIKKLKAETEIKILNMLQDFCKKTEVQVIDIKLDSLEISSIVNGAIDKLITNVDLKLEI